MRLRSVTVLALSLAFASYGSLTLRAQDASVAPGTEIDSCVRWMKATASGGVTRTLDPADFCSGIKRGSTDRRLVLDLEMRPVTTTGHWHDAQVLHFVWPTHHA